MVARKTITRLESLEDQQPASTDHPIAWRIETVDEYGNAQEVYGWESMAYGNDAKTFRQHGESAKDCADRAARLAYNPEKGRIPVLLAIHHPANKTGSGGHQSPSIRIITSS